jgi:Purple acid Phosphatase, N-terminal domain/Calcineurin-like phosphoesterase
MLAPLRWTYLALLLAFGATCVTRVAFGQGEEWTPLVGAAPAQVRVIWWHDPHTSATISWSTAVETRSNRALLTSEAGVELSFDSARDGVFSGSEEDDDGVYFHHARVTGLTPSTDYSLVLESDGERSREFRFRTAPDDERAFTLLYGGDSRTVHQNRQRVNRMISGFVAREEQLVAFVHGGDYVTDGKIWGQWKLWLSHHELCTTEDGRLLPIVPARGNHDRGVLYDEVFDDPGGAGLNYGSTRIGASLAIVTLNTNISTAGGQALWMEARLPELRAENRWLLAQYHRPMWPALKSPSPAKPLWVPLFEANDIDLVMESDGHVLKRTVPIREGKFDPTGVTYIGEGGLGAPLREPRRDLWYFQEPGFVGTGLHISLLDISPELLEIRTFGPPKLLDEFLPEGAAMLVDRTRSWSVAVDEQLPGDWMTTPQSTEGTLELPPTDWAVAETGRRTAGVARARVELSAGSLEGHDELGLIVPRGVPFRAWMNGVPIAERPAWRDRRWWKGRTTRFKDRPLEYVSIAMMSVPERETGNYTLAVEIELDPAVEAGAGPFIELVADPQNIAERNTDLLLLDEWKLTPRALTTTR